MNKFKDRNGRWLTISLFKETSRAPHQFVVTTVEEARKRFIKSNDITGYQYSTEYLGGYQHWKTLKASPAIKAYIEEWEEELEVKLQSEAVINIIDNAEGGSYQAQKYLADSGFTNKKGGRPSKATIQKEARKMERVKASAVAYLNPIQG